MEMETNETVQRKSTKKGGLNAPITIIILILIALGIFYGLFGSTGNFEGETTDGHPKNFMGIIYKGGVIIPFLMSFFLMVIVFGIDRFFALNKASRKGNITKFVDNIRDLVSRNQINEAMELCDQQQGSVGNVVKEGMTTYKA